jgi:sialate O-acetylesterase
MGLRFVVIFVVVVLCSGIADAEISLPRIFGSNMVLQRNHSIPIWGWGLPGEPVTIRFIDQTAKTVTAKNGKWRIDLKPEKEGGPYLLKIYGANEITLDNIMVGDVWLCSGQSNMEWPLRLTTEGPKYISESQSFKMIREFKVQDMIAGKPARDFPGGQWDVGDSTRSGNFTAVGYYFARIINASEQVPIGLINSTWGGTNIETWISKDAFGQSREYKGIFTKSFSDYKKTVKDSAWIGPNEYPALLYNAMINPLLPFAIKGVLWYQGESNADRAFQYRKAFPLMITDWRTKWKQGDFPFFFVQLAGFGNKQGNSNTGSSWAELREAQKKTLDVPNTGMAVAIDIGETNDIHPRNKSEVGRRLAAIALHKVYGRKNQFAGPEYESMKTEGGKVFVTFKYADSGLITKGKYNYPGGFELAGQDRRFHFARAEIQGDQVVLISDSVASPIAVRYAWSDDAPGANLYNTAGFPAVPFRTDSWRGKTDDNKYTIH